MKSFQFSVFSFQKIKKNGLTLIEVLVAMGIATLAGVLLVVIIVQSTGVFTKESSKVAVGVNINDTLSEIRNSIKQASSIANQYFDGSTTYVSGADQLVLKIASIDPSGNIIAETFDYFVFFRDGTNLRLKIFPDTASSRIAKDTLFTTSVNALHFQYFNSADPPLEVSPTAAVKIKVTLTLSQKTGRDFEVHTSTSEANLRND